MVLLSYAQLAVRQALSLLKEAEQLIDANLELSVKQYILLCK
jgi:hypothetical protein